ncbi:antileukoproteinase-like [Arctopsyche grandis]|uniref:antileukoproteinase-like n=1 Tax=Arctopsyche grandis TaxID=121162 RepID=UPI00406D8C8F
MNDHTYVAIKLWFVSHLINTQRFPSFQFIDYRSLNEQDCFLTSIMNSFGVVAFFVMFAVVIDEYHAQVPPMMAMGKPGSCPPRLTRSVCYDSCQSDTQCRGAQKCCRTSCGGTVCSRAVTARSNTNLIKPGTCPAPVEGPWMCSSTCSSDSDCRSKLKCCRNRCGAHVCSSPIIEPLEIQIE